MSCIHMQGYGVMGGRSEGPVEVEGEPGFSLTLGQIPGVRDHHTVMWIIIAMYVDALSSCVSGHVRCRAGRAMSWAGFEVAFDCC